MSLPSQTILARAGHRKRYSIVAVCLVLVIGVAVSLAMRGRSQTLRFSRQGGAPQFVPGAHQLVVSANGPGKGDLDLYLIDLDAMTYKPLLVTPDTEERCPILMHDGIRVVYVASRALDSTDSELFELNMQTGVRTQLTWSGGGKGDLVATPDHSGVVFARAGLYRSSSTFGMRWANFDLWRYSFADQTEEQLTNKRFYSMSAPWIAPTGFVEFRADNLSAGAGGLTMSLDLDDPQSTPGVPVLRGVVTGNDSDPIFSPDGKKAVFISSRVSRSSPYDYELWEFTVASGKVRQLTSLQSFLQFPSFSSDGSSIAFLSDKDRDDTVELMIYDVATGQTSPVGALTPEK